MFKFPIAIQLYSLRDEMAVDFEGTLKAVKEMGYDGVEFAGLFDKSAKEVKELCNKYGLVPISAHVSYFDMIQNENLFEVYAEIGCEYVVIPHISADHCAGNENFSQFVEGIKTFGKKANESGLKLCYHNHDFEFAKVDGEYALDILYNSVSADLLETELDTCWINVGGEDPVDYLLKYSGRANIVHLKDFVGGKSKNMYALIGVDENEQKDTKGQFEFRPLGLGLQNIPAILDAAQKAGTKWVVVEQDSPSMGKTPVECAKISIDYLKSL